MSDPFSLSDEWRNVTSALADRLRVEGRFLLTKIEFTFTKPDGTEEVVPYYLAWSEVATDTFLSGQKV